MVIRFAYMVAPTLTPGQILGHFRLIEEIGAGGMGIVYRARDERLLRDVAVKVLNPQTLADERASHRFRHEALILGRLNHPNVEAVYDFHSEHGLDYLVLEYVPGTSLNERVEQGALPEKEVIALGVQLARGLAAAHAQGIIHRDLKPGNLRVTPENVLKILDFGLAQLFAAPEAGTLAETVTVTLQAPGLAGTLAYMAPEQLAGLEPDTRSDVYSAGVVLYELATGSRPFPQRGQMLWEAVLHSLPSAPRVKKADISAGLEAVILKCLEKDPDLRYQSAAELLDDLSRLSAGQETTASAEFSGMVRFGKTRKTRVAVTLAAVLLLGILAGIVGRKWLSQPQAQRRIMAVLPFDSVGQDAPTNALGLGLTETLTAKLVQASDSNMIQVVSPRELRARGVKTAEDARREFGTDLVLEGSIQQSGQMYRIICNLVDSKTQHQITARTITADAADMFGLQDKVVTESLDMLPARIKPEQRDALVTHRDTQPAAYEAYIRGRGYLQEYEKPENIDNAINEFGQALKIDPNYAPALAGLGEAYWIGYQQLNRGNEWLTKASNNCEKALTISPELAAGHTCLGNVLKATGRYDKAVEQFQRAVDLDQNSEVAFIGLADSYQKLGNLPAAEAAYKKAISLRPNYWGVYSWLGAFYYNQARYSEAAETFRKVTELAPDNYRGYSNLGGIYLLQGRYEDAISQSKRSIDLRPTVDAYSNLGSAYFALHRFADAAQSFQQGTNLDDRNSMNWGNLGDALYWTPGRRSEAAAAYKKAITLTRAQLDVNPRDALLWVMVADYYAMLNQRAPALDSLQRALEIAPADPDVAFRAAIVYNHFGDTDRCLLWLKKAVDAGFSRSSIRDLPDFDALQGNPKFRALIASN
jgi:eukaryotic-like serine/threonine-protein kinase